MSLYAIGDLQGCYDELLELLHLLPFRPGADRLAFVGDLVNRGPKSLEVLRFVRDLGDAAVTVLGNHDLHLLARAAGGKPGKRDTLDAVLAAPDRDTLLDWLASRPLAWRDPASGALLLHAGVPPQWTAAQALELATDASAQVSGPHRTRFLGRMYGDEPDHWDPDLSGVDRHRFVVNCLTRLRYCTPDGRLAMKPKGRPGSQPEGLVPWFQAPSRRTQDTPIVFGHWSTLGRVAWPAERVHGLDTGCVWGGKLTAVEVGGAWRMVQVPSRQAADPTASD